MNLITPHINIHDLEIRSTLEKGRGVYATRLLPRGTTIEISPVLLFSQDEYRAYGRHTILDHYTFVWGDGRMALPLGLGSLFNHSQSPNVTYTKNKKSDCIEYTTTKDINPGEELCIFYGHKIWFVDNSPESREQGQEKEEEWAGSGIEDVY